MINSLKLGRIGLKRLAAMALSCIMLLSLPLKAQPALPVLTSFSILGDLVQVVGGERVSVTTLVGPDQDAHEFNPRPSDVRALQRSKVFVINGLAFEPWAQKLAKSAGYQGLTVVASSGVIPRPLEDADHEHAGHGDSHSSDPHAWQNPINVIAYVNNIAAALAQVDPAGAPLYRANAQAYERQLRTLDAWAQNQFATIPPDQRKAITSHDALGYLGARYQLTLLAPEGINPDAQPSARHVARLIRQIKREHIKAVFVESMRNPKFVTQLSRDAGVQVGATLYSDALSSAIGPAGNYLAMMRHNITQLSEGMRRP